MKFLIAIFLSAICLNAWAYIEPDQGPGGPPGTTDGANTGNGTLGSQISQQTTKALKTFQDVNCDKIGCKSNGAESFLDNSGDDAAPKKFKISTEADNSDEG